jgi:hypothetical protein
MFHETNTTKPNRKTGKIIPDELSEEYLSKATGGGGKVPTPRTPDEPVKQEVTFEYGGLQIRYQNG